MRWWMYFHVFAIFLLLCHHINIEIDWHFQIYSLVAKEKMLTHQKRRKIILLSEEPQVLVDTSARHVDSPTRMRSGELRESRRKSICNSPVPCITGWLIMSMWCIICMLSRCIFQSCQLWDINENYCRPVFSPKMINYEFIAKVMLIKLILQKSAILVKHESWLIQKKNVNISINLENSHRV